MPESIEWPRMHPPRRRRRFLLILAVLAGISFLARRFARHCGCNRCWHDGGMADARPLLARTAYRWWRRPDLWQAVELLSVHSARLAAPRRLATYAGRDYLCTRCFLRPHHGRIPCVRRASQQLRYIALAWALHRVCGPVAGPRVACVPRSIRAIV